MVKHGRFPGPIVQLQPGKRRLHVREHLHVFSQLMPSRKHRHFASSQVPSCLHGKNGFRFSQCCVISCCSHQFALNLPGGGFAPLDAIISEFGQVLKASGFAGNL